MENLKETIFKKLESAFRDMDDHSCNNYTDDSEYIIIFNVKELRWLYNELNDDYYHVRIPKRLVD